MRLAVSNVAWDAGEDDAVLSIMKRYAVVGLEVAPTKIWDHPVDVTEVVATAYRRRWEQQQIEIVAMQSLLFGQEGLELFNGPHARTRMFEYLTVIVRLAAWLGARALVFGSPQSRALHGMDRGQALEVAVEFFRRLADVAEQHGTSVCLEANPADYGSEFAQTTGEALDVVRHVGRPGFRLQLDTGSLSLTGEADDCTIERAFAFIGHVHVSEPHLRPIDTGTVDHRPIAAALKRLGYDGWVSLEMRSRARPSNAASLEAALGHVASLYGG
jgi:D-psicose/D-tagatose/L-ribulose 3-epimerase